MDALLLAKLSLIAAQANETMEKARANGITPAANPYIKYTNEAREWLDAYMDAETN